jgi:hypothetical protein
MTSRIYVYNHFRELETTIEDIPTTPRSWVQNGYGRCEFSVPLSDPKCQERYLQFGNFIRVEHIPTQTADEGDGTGPTGKLPDWTGVILPPRTWNDGTVNVTAYSAEAILAYRAMPYVTVTGTPDLVFKEIIGHVQSRNRDLVWNLGQVDTSTLTYSDDLKTNAYDHINKLVKFSGMDWDVTGRPEPESLALAFHVSLRNRINKSDSPTRFVERQREIGLTLTTENTEMQEPLLTEQGTPTNQIFAYTHAFTEADRAMQEIIYQGSYDDYGPFQINTVYVGQHDIASVADATMARLDERGRPSKLFKRVALDTGDTFSRLRIGALAVVDEPRVGFRPGGGFGFLEIVRIVSMDYNDTTNKVSMNIEVI